MYLFIRISNAGIYIQIADQRRQNTLCLILMPPDSPATWIRICHKHKKTCGLIKLSAMTSRENRRFWICRWHANISAIRSGARPRTGRLCWDAEEDCRRTGISATTQERRAGCGEINDTFSGALPDLTVLPSPQVRLHKLMRIVIV